jgi:hypothetical protein
MGVDEDFSHGGFRRCGQVITRRAGWVPIIVAVSGAKEPGPGAEKPDKLGQRMSKFLLAVLFGGVAIAAEAPAPADHNLFEWFLDTWHDVRTDPKSPEAVAQVQLAKCYVCHDGKSEPAKALGVPPIPFNDLPALKLWMKAERPYGKRTYTGKALILKLLWQDAHMPKGAIKFHERKALKKYLEKI